MAERIRPNAVAIAIQRLRRLTSVAIGRLASEENPKDPSPKTQRAVEKVTGSHKKN